MNLLQDLVVGRHRLPNRVVMAPMTRSRALAGKQPGPQTVRYYALRASAGLIVSEATHIDERTSNSERSAGIYTDAQVAAWSEVARAVHAAGGRMFQQLWHLGRAWHGGVHPAVGPSAIAARIERPDAAGVLRPLPVPLALDASGIRDIVAQYRRAALFAIEAGMDGVEIHAANGFLIDQFLRDGSNRRNDAYGGTPQRRARLLLEITETVCAAVGADRVGVRLSPRKRFNDMHDSTPLQTFGAAVSGLDTFGLAYLHLAAEAPGSSELEPGTEDLTAALRARFSGPLILNGGYDRERAERDLRAGAADAISFATAYIANPDLVRRLELNAPLNSPDRARFYEGGALGYTDYLTLEEQGLSAA